MSVTTTGYQWNFSESNTSRIIHFNKYKIAHMTTEQIELYGSLTLTPLGLILNILSLVIFYKCKLHKTATGLHLICIALADNSVLFGTFFNRSQFWVHYINIPSFSLINSFCCKFFNFFADFGFLWNNLLLASATIQRFISIVYPLKAKTWDMFYISKFLITVYFSVSVFFCSAIAYVQGITTDFEGRVCLVPLDKMEFYKVVDKIGFVIIGNGICPCLIVTFTVAIAVLLYVMKRKRALLNEGNDTNTDNEFRISLMLIIVTALFILSRVPDLIVYEILVYFYDKRPSEIYDRTLVVFPIAQLLNVFNHSGNFIIYFCFFKNFRETMLACFPRKSDVNQNSQISSLSTNVA